MVAVIADSSRDVGRPDPTSSEIEVLRLLCEVGQQEYGLAMPQRVHVLSALRQPAGSNLCTIMVSTVFPLVISSLRYDAVTDTLSLPAEFRKTFEIGGKDT